MTDADESGEQKTQRERLDEYLREQRDETHSMYNEAETSFDEGYAHGRYHAYIDVLVWMLRNWEDE